MTQTAKIFMTGRSQAVRLPMAFRFDTDAVFIHRDEGTGNVILSSKPQDWEGFLAAAQSADVPAAFLSPAERQQGAPSKDPFQGWAE